MERLPTLKSLRAFEAVALYGGVRAAAGELCVTQSAVSHQIHQLEAFLGVRLFAKKGRLLELTEQGRNYLQRVTDAIHQLEQATSQISQFKSGTPLTISAPPSFLANWLLPNLKSFEDAFPDTPLKLVQSLTLDASSPSADIAIEYRLQPSPGSNSALLFPDDLSVFAAPDYVKKLKLKSIDDLERARLIETERRLTSWIDVLSDKAWVRGHRFLSVPYSLHAFEAARLGLGVALGNRLNAAPLLGAGALITPFKLDKSRRIVAPKYFLTSSAGKLTHESAEHFRTWLMGKCRSA